MEPHKKLSGTEKYLPNIDDGPSVYFDKALVFTKTFYHEDMDRIASVRFDTVTPEFFFREYMFVVHATGFSARAVGNFFPRLQAAYGDWVSLGKGRPDEAVERVKIVCNNPQKIKAVHMMARMMHDIVHEGTLTWTQYMERALSTPELLQKLPYIGKITCFHLARNIGLLECVKPDLHLVRLAEHWGFKDCIEMCKMMQEHHQKISGELMPLGIVDLVVWYFSSTMSTTHLRKPGGR